MLATWPSPAGSEEYAFTFDRGRSIRLLLLPALFDESNKLRHFTIEVMRRLNAADIDSFLPDLPGCNESLALLERQDLSTWQEAAARTAAHFRATHVLSLRAGALAAPKDLRGWRYVPVSGTSALRALLRARVIAAKEAGRSETRDALLETGIREGLELAGYRLGAGMIAQLAEAELPETAQRDITQSEVGGAGLWLRAEPGHDRNQAESLARLIAAEAGA